MEQFTFLSSQIKTKEELFEYAWKRRYEIVSTNPGVYIHKDIYKGIVCADIRNDKVTTFKEVDALLMEVSTNNPMDFADQAQEQWANEIEEANQQEDELNELMTTFTIKSSQTNQKMYVTIDNYDILTKTADELAAQIAATIVSTDLIK
jgi:adenylate kinase family enzyme